MSQPYEYTDRDRLGFWLARISRGVIEVFGDSPDDQRRAITIPASERAKAAQALAGDQWSVVPKMEWEPVEQPQPIDPADIKVGDVVSVEANDGTWAVRGPVISTDSADSRKPLMVRAGVDRWIDVTGATVRVVRPAPDPTEQEIQELAYQIVGAATDEGVPIFHSVKIARALHARNVRIVGGEQ